MDERAYDRIDRAAKVAVWVVVVSSFVIVCVFLIDRFATLGIAGSLLAICVSIATLVGYRRRR
jgi:hypothetical protein